MRCMALEDEIEGLRRASAMGMILGESPSLPITVYEANETLIFDSLCDVGLGLVDWQEDRTRTGPHGPQPPILDANGARFRLIVRDSSLLLCTPVPIDYDPSQLALVVDEAAGMEMIIEVLGPQVHRALARHIGAKEFVHVPSADVERLTPLARDLPSASLPWWRFDGTWCTDVDFAT